MMIPTQINDRIPEWLKAQIQTKCRECGAYIIDNEALTLRKCINPRCIGHMAMKVEALAKHFGVKGIGPAAAASLIRTHKLTSHIDAIPHLVREKPTAFVWEIGELAMISGYGKWWRDNTAQCCSMDEVFEKPDLPTAIREKKEFLLHAQSFFSVSKPLLGTRANVMMTGSINGYSNRSMFLKMLNEKYGDMYTFVDVGKRKTGVDMLIKENSTVDHEKSKIAAQNGIRIIEPQVLVTMLENLRIREDNKSETA